MESCFAGTFFADIPTLYWIPFHARATGLARITCTPSPPSTKRVRSIASFAIRALLLNGPQYVPHVGQNPPHTDGENRSRNDISQPHGDKAAPAALAIATHFSQERRSAQRP